MRAAASAAASEAGDVEVREEIVLGAATDDEPVDNEEKHAEDAGAGAEEAETGGSAEENDMRALRKGMRVRKMPHSRNGSVRKTRMHIDEREGGAVITYDSRNKWSGDIEIPLSEVRVVEGPKADAFGKLGPKAKAETAERALSLEGKTRRLDVVFDTADDYERAVRGLRAMQAAEGTTGGSPGAVDAAAPAMVQVA